MSKRSKRKPTESKRPKSKLGLPDRGADTTGRSEYEQKITVLKYQQYGKLACGRDQLGSRHVDSKFRERVFNWDA
jgi:hypothetical protein